MAMNQAKYAVSIVRVQRLTSKAVYFCELFGEDISSHRDHPFLPGDCGAGVLATIIYTTANVMLRVVTGKDGTDTIPGGMMDAQDKSVADCAVREES